jgi:hypothetical protein
VPQPDTIHTAKEVATVDVLFDGRVIFGVAAGRTVQDRVLSFGDGWAPRIAGIEDDVFDRFARLQDRTDKPLKLTASGPDPDRRALAPLRDRGAHRALVWLPQDAGGAISDSDTGTIPRRRRGLTNHWVRLRRYDHAFADGFVVRTMRSALRVITRKMPSSPAAAIIMRDRVRPLTDDQLSQAEASQRISHGRQMTAGSSGAIAPTLRGIRWG